ncbi:MAG: 16S rRNA (cytidine(1402)-2'-O)-methyltransferase [Candidatus Yanofskybacteria bacterium]|nr:16S rRNA (cytidine(1402)-2'-O)-methyltransferase [Candidatus Yanofskybacteria bacterium]
MIGTLFVVATPIGNLEDITIRALRVLKEVDLVLCEDTRVTRKLLSRYEISVPTMSYHQHSGEAAQNRIFEMLQEEKNIALVCDSGTPGISDPGNELISFLARHDPDIPVVPIPGPAALSALASIAGTYMSQFLFLGFPPHKKGRKKFFQQVASSPYPVLFYESPHRILKSLRELKEALPHASLVVGRELTKQFETVYRGTIDEVEEKLQKDKVRGEFTVLVAKA